MRQSKKNKRNKRTKKKPELSGEPLMLDAIKRLAKINGNSATHQTSNTFDEVPSRKTSPRSQALTDYAKIEEKTPGEKRKPIADDDIITSDKEYVDLKVGKEILNFEKKLVSEIQDGKSSIQRWGIGLIVSALIASAGLMIALQLFSTQHLRDYINNNFTEKITANFKKLNQNISIIQKDQSSLEKKIIVIDTTLNKIESNQDNLSSEIDEINHKTPINAKP